MGDRSWEDEGRSRLANSLHTEIAAILSGIWEFLMTFHQKHHVNHQTHLHNQTCSLGHCFSSFQELKQDFMSSIDPAWLWFTIHCDGSRKQNCIIVQIVTEITMWHLLVAPTPRKPCPIPRQFNNLMLESNDLLNSLGDTGSAYLECPRHHTVWLFVCQPVHGYPYSYVVAPDL